MTKLSSLLNRLRRSHPGPPQFEGLVEKRTIHHVAGWALDRANLGERVTVEALLKAPEGERVLGRAVADVYYGALSLQSSGDVRHGFELYFDPPLSAAERDALMVRVAGTETPLAFATLVEPPGTEAGFAQSPALHGYIDELSLARVCGWIMDPRDLASRLEFEVVLALAGESRVIARGVANQPYAALRLSNTNANDYGFTVEFPAKLTPLERDSLIVRAVGQDDALSRAPQFQGFVDELSTRHVAGWVRNRFRPETQLAVEAVLTGPNGEQKLAEAIADAFHAGLAAGATDDGYHGFYLRFAPPLNEAQLGDILIRVPAEDFVLPRSVFATPEHAPPGPSTVEPPAPAEEKRFLGYIDDLSLSHVAGWIFDVADPGCRVEFEAVSLLGSETRIIARGRADLFYPPLAAGDFGDAKFGFAVDFSTELTIEERDSLVIRPAGHEFSLPRAPKFQGGVDERSCHHAVGWVRNRFDPTARVSVEAILPTEAGDCIVAQGKANSFNAALASQSIGDGRYGFSLLFTRPLTEAERDTVAIRPVGGDPLPLAPNLLTNFKLLSFFAMDIVNNCNLRCPFCLFDYSETKSTRFMSDETFEAALRFIPYVNDGDFWLSCLHEPSLHPDFLRLIERIPRQWRHKVMFTTNLAKRMPESYFAALAASGVHHINISLESLDPAIFERMRKGARFPIFKENWEKLLTAWRAASAPPRLRYIMMAYKSNLAEIPGLVKYLREERLSHEVEVRYTYDMDHIPLRFREAEYLCHADWAWLAQQLSIYDPEEVQLSRPPEPLDDGPAPAMKSVSADELHADVARGGPAVPQPRADTPPGVVAEPVAPRPRPPASEDHSVKLPLNMQVEWSGKMVICGRWDHPSERRLLDVADINGLQDPYDYLIKLPSKPKIQGYVDEMLSSTVTGWVRNLLDPEERVRVNVAIALPGETRIIAEGVADILWPTLIDSPFGDGRYGFRIEIPEALTVEERDHLIVAPAHDNVPLRRAPKYQGYVDERSLRHVRGWVRNRFDPAERVTVEAVITTPAGEEILWTGRADRYDHDIAKHAVGDARYGFRFEFNQPLTEAERDCLVIRPAGTPTPLELSPRLVSNFVPDRLTPA